MPCKNHPLIEDGLVRCSRCAEAFCPDCVVEIGGQPYCLSCKTESVRDLRSGVSAHQLELASLGRRFAAIFVDGLVLMVPVLLIFFLILAPLGMGGLFEETAVESSPLFVLATNFATLLLLALGVVYEGLMLSAGGQTVGKKALGVKVVTADGSDITRGQAWTRAVTRQLLGLIPCLGLVDYLVAFGQEKTAVHDIVPKTRVINWHA